YYQIKDAAGNLSSTYSDSIILDTTPPTGSIVINNNDTYTTSTSVTLTLTYSDATSGVSQVRYSNDGVWDTEPWESPAATKSWTLLSGDGTKTVYYQIKDAAGNLSSTYSDSIILDTTPPTGSIVINDDNMYTNSTSVVLTLTYSDATSGVNQVCYSNDGQNWTAWESPTPVRYWTLLSGDGLKTVYFKIMDNAGNVYTCSDLITLDTTPPTAPLGLYTNPSTSSDNYSSDTTPIFGWTTDANDNLSGVAKYQIRTDSKPEWADFTNGSEVPEGYISSKQAPNVIHVRAVDKAGNVSQESSIEYYCDNSPPVITSLSIAEGENREYQHVVGNDTVYYNTSVSGSFVVTVSASDSESGIRKVVFPALSGFASPNGGENTSMPASWTYYWLTSSTQNGSKSITVYNKAGLTTTVNIYVYRDVSPPSGGFICYEDAYLNTLQVQVRFEVGSDSGAGLGPAILQRSSAALSDGQVGSWSEFSDLAVNPSSPYLDNAVSSGMAYRYRLLVYDLVNNCAIYTSDNSVKVDTGPPSISSFYLKDNETGSSSFAKSRTVRVEMENNDAESGVWKWYLSEDSSAPVPENFTSTKPETFTLSEGDGEKTVYAWVMDRAGNISENRSWTITLDTTPPTGSILIDNGREYTNSPNVILTLTWSDVTSGVLAVRYLNEGGNWTDWVPPENTRAWTLSEGDGLKTVYYQLKDAAGNITTVWDSIVLDTTPDNIPWLGSPTHPNQNEWYPDNSPQFWWGIPSSTSPIVGYSFLLDGVESTVPDETVNISENSFSPGQLADGVWYFHIRAKDAAGNWGSPSHFRVQIDVTPDGPPAVSSPTHPDQSRWYNNRNITVEWSPAPWTAPVVGYLWYGLDDNPDTIPENDMEGVEWTTGYSASLYAGSDGTWYFHIRAKDAAGNWGQTAHFRFNIDTQPPVAPTLLLPGNGSILADNRPTFRWEHQEGENIENYELEIYDNAGSLLLVDNSPVKWYDPENTLPDGQYRWRVRAIDRAGNLGAWSENFIFLIDSTPPPAPSLLSPENNCPPMHVLGPTLLWEAVSDMTPVTYELQVSEDENFNQAVVWAKGLTENSYLPEETLSGTFYWRVRARDAAGNVSEWSETWVFTNYSHPPRVTNVLVDWKVNPRKVAGNHPWISWTFVDEDNDSQRGAHIQVSVGSPGDRMDYCDPDLTENYIMYLSGLLTRGTIHYVRVRVRDNLGVWGPWSDDYNFQLNHPPRIENLRINGEFEAVNIGRPIFSWDFHDEDGDEPVLYQIRLGTASGLGDVWDSGELEYRPGFLISLPEDVLSQLSENTRYYVQIRVKDGTRRGAEIESYSWSEPISTSFVTNLRPKVVSAKINGGATYTNSRQATLSLRVARGAQLTTLFYRLENGSEKDLSLGNPGEIFSVPITLEGEEGMKEVWVRVRDVVGWESEESRASIILDLTPPTGLSGVSPPNGSSVGSSPVRLSWTMPTDSISGVVSLYTLEVSHSESFSNPQVFTTEKNYYDLPLGGQEMTLYWRVRVKDRAGNESCTPVYRFTYQPALPSLVPTLLSESSIVNNPEIRISVRGSNVGWYRYAFSSDDLLRSSWVPYAENVLTLTLDREGQYMIYFQAKSPSGVVGDPVVVPIFLDLSAPYLELKADNVASSSVIRTLYFFTTDMGGSGVSQMRLRFAGDNWGPWENFQSKRVLQLREGLNVVEAQVRDRAGNESIVARLELYYSVGPPALTKAVVENLGGEEEVLLEDLPTVLTRPIYTLRIPAKPGVILFVNGERIEPKDGYWVVNLTLREGKNAFTFSTVDLAGATWSKSLEFIYSPERAKPKLGSSSPILLFSVAGAGGLGVVLAIRLKRARKPPVMVPKTFAVRPKAVKPFVREKRERPKEGD
ncbi:MAG: hypothetical protein QXG14_04550, partial [Candidatus Hadarchaeales archaeon]